MIRERNVIKVVLENICNSKLITEINAVQTPQVCTAVIKVPAENMQQQMEMKGLPSTDVSFQWREPRTVSTDGSRLWLENSNLQNRLSELLVAGEPVIHWASARTSLPVQHRQSYLHTKWANGKHLTEQLCILGLESQASPVKMRRPVTQL